MFKQIVVGILTGMWWGVEERRKQLRNKKRGEDIDELERPTSKTGDPVPVVFGTMNIENPNVVWFGDSYTDSVVRDGKVVQLKYYCGMHFALCVGSADKLIRVRCDDKLVYKSHNSEPDVTQTEIDVALKFLFNADGMGGGGVAGTIRFEQGLPDQAQNSYMNGLIEQEIPAYRGITGIVLEDMYVGTENQLKDWDFQIQRILKRYSGLDQWYPDKVLLPTISLSSDVDIFDYNTYWDTLIGNVFSDYPDFLLDSLFDNDSTSEQSPLGDVTTLTPDYPVNTSWEFPKGMALRKTLNCDGVHDVRITGQIYRYCSIHLNQLNQQSLIWPNQELEDYDGDLYDIDFVIPVEDLNAGENKIYVWGSGYSALNELYFYLEAKHIPLQAMNPVHAIRECLTDIVWGMGYAENNIDDISFQYAADTVYDENLGICMKFERTEEIENFVYDLLRYIEAELYPNRVTGKYTIKLIRDDYDESSLYEMDTSNVDKVSSYKRVAFGELVNSVVIDYYNFKASQKSAINIKNNALIQSQGGLIQKRIDYTAFITSESATLAGYREMKTLSNQLLSVKISAFKEAEQLNIGDVFKLTWPDYGIADMTMRVQKMRLGDGNKRTVEITATQDIFDTPSITVEIDDPVDPPGVPIAPGNPDPIMKWELPYYWVNKEFGQGNWATIFENDYTASFFGVAAGRGPATVNFDLHTRLESTDPYDNVGTFDFCPTAQLDADISYMDTSFNIVNRTNFPGVKVGMFLQIDSEIMRVVSIDTGNQITVERGMLDAIVAEHDADADVIFFGYALAVDPTQYEGYCEAEEPPSGPTGDTVRHKLQANGPSSQKPLWSCEEDNWFLRQRPRRPYPPGNLKINGDYFPDSITGDLVLTWEHRDRLDLNNLVDFTATGVTSESGVTYRFEMYDSGGTSIYQTSLGSATTYTYDFVTLPDPGESCTIRIYSVKANESEDFYDSYFKYNISLDRDDYGNVIKDTFGNSNVIKSVLGNSSVIKDKMS